MANILNYNQGLTQYKQGNYGAAQQSVAPFGSQVQALFAPPAPSQQQPALQGAPAQSQPQQQPQQDPNLDAIFAPGFQSLDAAQGLLTNTILPSQLNMIDQQGNLQRSDLANQNTENETQFQSDKGYLSDEQRAAYAQAVNDYNKLNQRNQSLYGGQSSAGQAFSDISNGQFMQTSSNVNKAYAQSLGNLLQAHQKYSLWNSQQLSTLDTQIAQMKEQAQNEYLQQLQQLNSDRSQLESQKQAKKFDLLQNVINRQADIRQYAAQKEIDIKAAAQAFQQQFELQGQALAQQHAQFIGSNPFQGSNVMDFSPVPSGTSNGQGTFQYNYTPDPTLLSKAKDDYSNYLG